MKTIFFSTLLLGSAFSLSSTFAASAPDDKTVGEVVGEKIDATVQATKSGAHKVAEVAGEGYEEAKHLVNRAADKTKETAHNVAEYAGEKYDQAKSAVSSAAAKAKEALPKKDTPKATVTHTHHVKETNTTDAQGNSHHTVTEETTHKAN